MTEPTPHTTQLRHWLERYRTGDATAADALVRATCGRLESLARKMLRGFPHVRCNVETDDVLQSALVRLLRALETMAPASMRDFYNLAAVQMRRELLDLARHFRHTRQAGENGDPAEAEQQADDQQDLERWERFHEEVDRLPVEERELVSLIFYHDWSQAQVAELFGITVRTVQRRWQATLLKLHHLLHEE